MPYFYDVFNLFASDSTILFKRGWTVTVLITEVVQWGGRWPKCLCLLVFCIKWNNIQWMRYFKILSFVRESLHASLWNIIFPKKWETNLTVAFVWERKISHWLDYLLFIKAKSNHILLTVWICYISEEIPWKRSVQIIPGNPPIVLRCRVPKGQIIFFCLLQEQLK